MAAYHPALVIIANRRVWRLFGVEKWYRFVVGAKGAIITGSEMEHVDTDKTFGQRDEHLRGMRLVLLSDSSPTLHRVCSSSNGTRLRFWYLTKVLEAG